MPLTHALWATTTKIIRKFLGWTKKVLNQNSMKPTKTQPAGKSLTWAGERKTHLGFGMENQVQPLSVLNLFFSEMPKRKYKIVNLVPAGIQFHRACQCFPFRIASWLVCPIFPTVRGRILDFIELCNTFVYCWASYFRGRSLTSCRRFPHTSGLPLDSCLLPNIHARWREKKYFSHFIELWNEIFQSQLLPPRRGTRITRMGVGTLCNQYYYTTALYLRELLGAKHTSYMPSIVQLYFINIDEILTANCKKKYFSYTYNIFFLSIFWQYLNYIDEI